MQPKLTKKLQVLLAEDEVEMLHSIILNDAIKNKTRPVSISAFIRDIVREEITKRDESEKNWNPTNITKIKPK